VEDGEVGAGDGAEAIAQVRDPGDGAAEVEAQRQLHAHGDLAADAFDDAEDVGVGSASGHEVDEADGAFGGLEGGFEDQGVGAIAAGDADAAFGRRDLPVAVVLCAEQGGEAGVGGEVRPAEPVDGAFAADQRGRFTVADYGVVFDSCGHWFLWSLGSDASVGFSLKG
jgi:hypothetical protein